MVYGSWRKLFLYAALPLMFGIWRLWNHRERRHVYHLFDKCTFGRGMFHGFSNFYL